MYKLWITIYDLENLKDPLEPFVLPINAGVSGLFGTYWGYHMELELSLFKQYCCEEYRGPWNKALSWVFWNGQSSNIL